MLICYGEPWSYDFVEDRTHNGRKFRMLSVIDGAFVTLVVGLCAEKPPCTLFAQLLHPLRVDLRAGFFQFVTTAATSFSTS
jgi:hypothetical protein